jgi:hypothetical protein
MIDGAWRETFLLIKRTLAVANGEEVLALVLLRRTPARVAFIASLIYLAIPLRMFHLLLFAITKC